MATLTADFLWFNDQIINKRDILRIYKSNITNKEEDYGNVDYGIRLVIRNSGDLYERYGDDQAKRNRRFESLIKVLC